MKIVNVSTFKCCFDQIEKFLLFFFWLTKRWLAMICWHDLSTNTLRTQGRRQMSSCQEYIVSTRRKWVCDLQAMEWSTPGEARCTESDLLCRVRLRCSACRCVCLHKSSADECVSTQDESKTVVCDVVYQNKSAGSRPARPSLFTGTDVTVSNFKVC